MAQDRDDSQRTEQPTQRRLDDAHRKGDIVKSAKLATLIVLGGGVLALAIFGAVSVQRFSAEFRVFLESPGEMVIDPGTASALLQHATFGLLAVLGHRRERGKSLWNR